MVKKVAWFGALVILGVTSGVMGMTQPAAAKSYGSPKTLRGVKYTRTTPVRSRGTWYNWDRNIGASKIIVKKHQVKWYSKPHKHGKWHHDQTLTGKKLYVYRQTLHHKKMFGSTRLTRTILTFSTRAPRSSKERPLSICRQLVCTRIITFGNTRYVRLNSTEFSE